ncbi:hypothetical protein GCM10010441_61780 [Kitasatospora paracochleata]
MVAQDVAGGAGGFGHSGGLEDVQGVVVSEALDQGGDHGGLFHRGDVGRDDAGVAEFLPVVALAVQQEAGQLGRVKGVLVLGRMSVHGRECHHVNREDQFEGLAVELGAAGGCRGGLRPKRPGVGAVRRRVHQGPVG